MQVKQVCHYDTSRKRWGLEIAIAFIEIAAAESNGIEVTIEKRKEFLPAVTGDMSKTSRQRMFNDP